MTFSLDTFRSLQVSSQFSLNCTEAKLAEKIREGSKILEGGEGIGGGTARG